MSGVIPDDENDLTENPDPEADSAVIPRNNELETSDDRVEGDINLDEISNEDVLEHAKSENHGEVDIDHQCDPTENIPGGEIQNGDDSSLSNQEGNDKTEDEQEEVGVIREGQISCGRDEQVAESLGQEETEADAALGNAAILEKCDEENENTKSPAQAKENNSEVSDGLCNNQTETKDNELRTQTQENKDLLSVEVTESGLNIECGAQSETDNVNSSCSGVNIVPMPEDEISCENWMSEDKPLKSHKLSHTESVESYEPECDQETDESHVTVTRNDDPCDSDSNHSIPMESVVFNPPSTSNSNVQVPSSSTSVISSHCCENLSPSSSDKSTGQKNYQTDCVSSQDSETLLEKIQDSDKSGKAQDQDVRLSPLTVSDDDLLSELESELTNQNFDHISPRNELNNGTDVSFKSPNGLSTGLDEKLIQQIQDLQKQIKLSQSLVQESEAEIQRLKTKNQSQEVYCEKVLKERDAYLKEVTHLKSQNQDDLYLPQIKELEYTIAQQTTENRTLKEKLSSHDNAAKRAVTTLQNELKVRVDQVTKMYEEANREKDNMVMKYAQAEKKFIESQKTIERLESRVREVSKEKEGLIQRVKDIKGEKKHLAAELETKSTDMQNLLKEFEKQKEMLSSSDVRIKWAQNKLKAELDAHKETKNELDKTRLKLKDAKDETEQIRKDCQAIIKTYQESEEIKSNELDTRLKMKESEFLQQQQEKSSQKELYSATLKELETLKSKHKEILAEYESSKKKCQTLEEQKSLSDKTMDKFKEMLQKQKKENRELQERVEELVQVKSDFKRAQSTIKSLDAEITELKISNKDLVIDMEACGKRESEKLELTEKLSAKNAELQSENTILHNQSLSLTSEVQKLTIDLQSLDTEYRDVCDRLKKEELLRKEETTKLREVLEEKSKAVEELTIRIEDEKDEIKTLKRKHVNNVKDLTRQLQQAKRKLENHETNGETCAQKDTTSMGSRTSSNGSLNTVGVSENNSQANSNLYSNKYPGMPEPVQEYPVITEQVEPDRQMLIERIVKLQRGLARRNEKIEFMQEHIQQLVDEIQKKNRIIQSYALREESGTMTMERADLNKAELARKHSIMGSLYSSHQTDSGMTLDLSLEINGKLQAVLEDTLLKNITLKESLDTLGEEIARLSQENRKLQLQIQDRTKIR